MFEFISSLNPILVSALIAASLGCYHFYLSGFRPKTYCFSGSNNTQIKLRIINKGRGKGSISDVYMKDKDILIPFHIYPFKGGGFSTTELGGKQDMVLICEKKDEENAQFNTSLKIYVHYSCKDYSTSYSIKSRHNKNDGFLKSEARLPNGK